MLAEFFLAYLYARKYLESGRVLAATTAAIHVLVK